MAFNLLEKLLPPENKIFYTCFEDSAEICKQSAILFHEIMTSGFNEDRFIRAKSFKHKSSDIAKLTLYHLNSTFVTPIDREDIQLVASLLNKITKRIIKVSINLKVYRLDQYNENMKKQAETLIKATEELTYIVSLLKKISLIKEITESHNRMREVESHGDEIYHKAMDELFSGQYDALSVIKLRDIYKDIESAMDSCFSVSDNIVNIVLKHG